jgi:hypothetical protein
MKSLLITIVLILVVHGQSNDVEQDSANKIVKYLLLEVDKKFEAVNEKWSEQLANLHKRLDQCLSHVTNQIITDQIGQKINYTGVMAKGLAEGQGEAVWEDGGIYKGNWRGGLRHGKGTYNDSNGVYAGNWDNDNRSGNGTKTYWSSGDVYLGNWDNDKRSGKGTYT